MNSPAASTNGNPPPAAAPAFDTSRFIDQERYKQDLGVVARTPFYMAQVADIQLEHHKLFPDKPLSQQDIVKGAMEAKADPASWYETTFKASERRQEMAWQEREKTLRQQWATEAAHRFSQNAGSRLNPNPPVGPVMALRAERAPQSTDPRQGRPDPSSRVAGAIAAYTQHKYASENRQRP